MKTAYNILKAVLCVIVAVFIGKSVWRYVDYVKHPIEYEVMSAPWYTSILIEGIAVAVGVLAALVAMFLLKRKMCRTDENDCSIIKQ